MVSDYDAYRYYLAIKTHFTNEKFDVFKERGTRCSIDSFLQRNDCNLFGTVARKFENPQKLIRFYVSNISIGFSDFLYDFEKSINNLNKWESYRSNIKYNLLSDLSNIELHFLRKKSKIFKDAAWKCYLEKSIHIQTIFLVNKFCNIFDELSNSVIFLHKEDILRIKKLDGFIRIPSDLEYILNKKVEEIESVYET